MILFVRKRVGKFKFCVNRHMWKGSCAISGDERRDWMFDLLHTGVCWVVEDFWLIWVAGAANFKTQMKS